MPFHLTLYTCAVLAPRPLPPLFHPSLFAYPPSLGAGALSLRISPFYATIARNTRPHLPSAITPLLAPHICIQNIVMRQPMPQTHVHVDTIDRSFVALVLHNFHQWQLLTTIFRPPRRSRMHRHPTTNSRLHTSKRLSIMVTPRPPPNIQVIISRMLIGVLRAPPFPRLHLKLMNSFTTR